MRKAEINANKIIEYHNKVLTKLFGGNSRYGCYFLAAVIFGIGILRDTM
jgi:phosphatidylethanolamine N-methyltransferase